MYKSNSNSNLIAQAFTNQSNFDQFVSVQEKEQGRPATFYHINDINAYQGRQRFGLVEGSQTKRTYFVLC